MTHIFLDESGDLGFSQRSSKWFLFTLAITNDQRALEHVVKKTWKTLRKKHKHIGELHASQEKDITRIRILKKKAPRFDGLPSGNPTREVLLLITKDYHTVCYLSKSFIKLPRLIIDYRTVILDLRIRVL